MNRRDLLTTLPFSGYSVLVFAPRPPESAPSVRDWFEILAPPDETGTRLRSNRT